MPLTRQNGTAISTFRDMRGMSRNALVDKIIRLDTGIKMSYPYLANIENEHKEAPSATLHAIAAVLDVPVAAILRRPIYAEQEQAS